MPYITKYRLRHTLYHLEGRILDDPIKRLLKDRLFFLSKNHREYLGVFLLFVKDRVKFIMTHHIVWKDTFTYILEKNPAFHTSSNCEMLTSTFDNVYIPSKIKNRGLSSDLRQFSNIHEKLFSNNRTEFIRLCISYFNSEKFNLSLTETDFIPIAKLNSGVADYHNATISEILDAIKKLLSEVNDFLSIEENATVARNLGDRLYLKDKPDLPRPLGLSSDIVRQSLNQLDAFNREFLNAFSEYYLALFNPKNEYDATILKILNFKACGACYAQFDISKLFDFTKLKSYEERNLKDVEPTSIQEIEALLTF